MTSVQTVPLSELLVPHEDWFVVGAGEKHTEITVKLHGKGIVRRSEGHNPAKVGTRRNRVNAGQFVASRIDARNGAFGILPAQLSGAIVSQDFPVFDIRSDIIDPSYLSWLVRTPQFVSLCRQSSLGTTNRARLETSIFLRQRVPLPPLSEQRRIVGILNHAASIRRLREQARAKAREIVPALFVEMFGDPATNPKGWPMPSVGEVLAAADYGTSVKASEAPLGVPVLRMGNVSPSGDLLLDDLKYASLTDADVSKFALAKDDILFNRTNSKDLVGKAGLWDGRFPAVAASYFIRLRVVRETMEPVYFWAFFNTRHMKRRLFETARGAIGQANINTKELRAFSIPRPPLALQLEFAERVAEIEGVAALNDKAAATAEQLSQSLLAQVFGDTAAASSASTVPAIESVAG